MSRLVNWLHLIIKRQKRLKRWQRLVTVFAAIITFATTYALILPAITVEKDSTGEVGGMYLEETTDRDDLFLENALEPVDVSTDDEAKEADETDAEIPYYDESAALSVKNLEASGTDYIVTLTYDDASGIPEGAVLTASEIAQDSEEYQTYLDETKKAMGLTEEETLPSYAARFFDIKIMVGEQEFTPESGVSVEITYTEPLAEYPETEVNAVHFADEAAGAEVIEANTAEVQDDGKVTVEFTAESFSVYGVIYTVDFHYEVNGKIYEFSIPGGGFASFYKIVEVLGISNQGTQSGSEGENEAEKSEIEAGNGENTDGNAAHNVVEESGVEDIGTYSDAISLNNVEVSEAAKQFVADVASVAFSSPELMWVGKVDETTTVGGLKDANGLEVQYSAELTEEQIAEINSSTVEGGDWALISVLPFDTEESLIVTMKNGDQFVVKVTDAQEISATNDLDVNNSYILCYEENGIYHVLKTDGTVDSSHVPADFDALDNSYRWTFYYVFREKDQLHNLDIEYYFIRPISDKTTTISLNEAGSTVIEHGTNNIGILPQTDSGFVFEGYTQDHRHDVKMFFNGSSFVATEENSSVITIYKQDPLPKYGFTVVTDNSSMGKVLGTDEDGHSVDPSGVVTYISVTNTDTDPTNEKTNLYDIKAIATPNTANANNPKYVFDHWTLNGEVLYQKDSNGEYILNNDGEKILVGETIRSGTLNIPYNSSELRAFFINNPNYSYTKDEKLGRTVDTASVTALSDELKAMNMPLVDGASKKTAEVFDYENRIYRVDLTSQGSMATFSGDIDLGFILDVSASMLFPSKLVKITSLTSVDIRALNGGFRENNVSHNQVTSLNTSKTYYIISDEPQTATVYKIWHNGSEWRCIDASKTGNGDRITQNTHFKAKSYGTNDPRNYDHNYYYQIYEDGDAGHTRSYYLEQSLNGAARELSAVRDVLSVTTGGKTDLDIKVAWNTFCNYITEQRQYTFSSITPGGITLTYDRSDFGGGTSTDIAILDAAGYKRSDILNYANYYDHTTNIGTGGGTRYYYNDWDIAFSNQTYESISGKGFQWTNANNRYAVLITDGAPQRGGNSVDFQLVQEAARRLKEQGVTLITIGLSMENVDGGSELLFDIASSSKEDNYPLFYSAKSGDELEDILNHIIHGLIDDAIVVGTITDKVNEAFYPVNSQTGKPLVDNDIIDLSGKWLCNGEDSLTEEQKANGYGKIIVMNDGTHEIKWTDQNIYCTSEGWHGTVYVKAKEDLLGGNAVLTNKGSATVEATGYRMSATDQILRFKDELTSANNPLVSRSATMESPRVNINELSFPNSSTDWTVYLGTSVDPKEQLKKIWDNILVEEVVKVGHATDIDGDNLPEVGTDSDDNNWYSLTESIEDSRENTGTGARQTFKMADLIKSIAEDTSRASNYSWWNYTTHEPNWDIFLRDAMIETQAKDADGNLLYNNGNPVMEVSGFTIPYKVYGIDDNSYIRITLEKEILDGEETDIINKSPHNTTVTGTPAERYVLSVLYSPDYSVLPKGQGGTSTEDFHTGTFTIMGYQGHAAGTETSTNTHTINVYAEPLDVLKKDDHDALVPGAVFKLYRTAKQGETGELLSTYDASLTGSYYCISTAASGADGVAHLAPDDTTTPVHTIPVANGQTAQNLLVPLAAGETYYLVEYSAPSGYKKDTTVKTVTVEVGPEFYTKLDKTTAVEVANLDATTGRPTIVYNWDEGVTFIVKDLGSDSTDNQATLVNHDTREGMTLTDAGGNKRTYMLRSDSEQQVVSQVLILNNVVVDIKIKKTDLNGKGLAGAIFQMKAVNNGGLSESDVDGITGIGTVSKTIDGETRTFTSAFETTGEEQTFSDLPDGTYRLYEAYVPAGYISTFRYIQFTIENRVMKDVTTDSGTSDKVVPTAADGNSLALLTIKNTPGAALPNTGGPGTTIFYLLCLLLTSFAGTGMLMKRRRRKVA